MKLLLFISIVFSYSVATQWQIPQPCQPAGIAFTGPSFTSDNNRIYCVIYYSTYRLDIAYYDWDGSQWGYINRIQGDVNSDHDEEEPFITHDSQQLYYTRSVNQSGTPRHILVATWNGIGFYNSVELNAQINSADCRFPSLSQDNQKLYFARTVGGILKIFETSWNGSDWGNPIMLSQQVNGPDNHNRMYVTISPDGNEIYFTGAGSYQNRLAFSQKISGLWQQWQYCDSNVNLSNCTVSDEALTYAPYSTQELYFARNYSPGTVTWHALRSPVAVEPASLGQIKANYAK